MSDQTIKILLVEDNPADAQYLQEILAESRSLPYELTHEKSLAGGLARAGEKTFDVALLDLTLPDCRGLDTFVRLHKSSPGLPIVVLTGVSDEDLAVEAVRKGAQDYLVKGQVDWSVLSRALRYAIERQGILLKLAQLEKMKDDFVSHVSHELRTPMTIIKEGVSQVADGLHGSVVDAQKQCLSHALKAIERLGRVVDNLLDISKIEAGKMRLNKKLIDVADIARRVIQDFSSQAKAKGLELRADFPAHMPKAYADEDKVVQVFVNLIGNALKFTEKGHIRISLIDGESAVECSVSDTGMGIASEDLPKVFDKFEQFGRKRDSHHKGTGLGLAISKSIVEAHGGSIRIESRLGQGTSFLFSLPKYTIKVLFQEFVVNALLEAAQSRSVFSLAILDSVAPGTAQELEALLKNGVLRASDRSLRDDHRIYIFLPGAGVEDTPPIAQRIAQVLRANDKTRGTGARVHFSSYPTDGTTVEELFAKMEETETETLNPKAPQHES